MDMRPFRFCSILGVALLLLPSARADDEWYGCKVLLCLANPNGPKAVEECHPPIDRFIAEQHRPHPPALPKCDQAQPAAYLTTTQKPFPDCPAGFVAVAKGQEAEFTDKGLADYIAKMHSIGYMFGRTPDRAWRGIGEGDDFVPTDETVGTQKICARGPQGSKNVASGYGESGSDIERVDLYDEIIRLDYGYQQYADVYIDGQLFRSVGLE
jgi:hypothetical protein